jgi:hypothetical protein
MKVQIELIDDNGITFEGFADLTPRVSSSPSRRATHTPHQSRQTFRCLCAHLSMIMLGS